MAQLMISRSRPIRSGASIQISGAKNASLPEMAACLLTKEVVTLKKVPQITDIEHMIEQLRSYGVQVRRDGSTLTLDSSCSRSSPENASAGRKIRGSFLVLGALVARFGQAEVPIPGGCEIGKGGRPVDFHIDALKKMGAKEVCTGNVNCITLKTEAGGLRGARIHFPKVSVGATENIMMAACLAKGQTIITNAAVEPEVTDLVNMLNNMEAGIQVDQKKKEITIDGQQVLSGITHTVIPDRIEAGTYAIAAATVGGTLLLKMDPRVGQEILVPVIEKLITAGVQVTSKRDGLEIKRSGDIKPVYITTGPYPEFPTDLLPQWATFMTLAKGISRLEDTIYDGRFKHVKYLKKMGAKIEKESDSVYYVHGVPKLTGTVEPVQATDLRAGMALILAALAAEGTTVVKNIEHVLRGYENLEEKLKQCGAKIEKVKEIRPGLSGGAKR